MFSFSRSKLTQSTLSLTSRRSSSEEFDDCCSQMDSPPAPSPSPSCYNYQDRVLALFIQQQRSDCTSSSSSSSSTSPSPDDSTPLGVCHFVSSRFVPLIYLRPPNICQKKTQYEKSIFFQANNSQETHSTRMALLCSEIEDARGNFICSFRELFGIGGER